MGIGDGVDHALPRPARADQPRLLQKPELMRDRGARHLKHGGKLGNTKSVTAESAEDPDARRVAAQLKKLRSDFDLVFSG